MNSNLNIDLPTSTLSFVSQIQYKVLTAITGIKGTANIGDILLKIVTNNIGNAGNYGQAKIENAYFINTNNYTLLALNEVLNSNIELVSGSSSAAPIGNTATSTDALQIVGNTTLNKISSSLSSVLSAQIDSNTNLNKLSSSLNTQLSAINTLVKPNDAIKITNGTLNAEILTSSITANGSENSIIVQQSPNSRQFVGYSSAVAAKYRNATLSNTPSQIKSTGGRILAWNAINKNTIPIYIKIYDLTAPVIGTSTPLQTIAVGANSYERIPINFYTQEFFNTAIVAACVVDILDTNNTAPTIPVFLEVWYL
jgi:hypothetical protein